MTVDKTSGDSDEDIDEDVVREHEAIVLLADTDVVMIGGSGEMIPPFFIVTSS